MVFKICSDYFTKIYYLVMRRSLQQSLGAKPKSRLDLIFYHRYICVVVVVVVVVVFLVVSLPSTEE
jgi:hypothetical protein